ncbi:MAG: phenylpyruvate tautomerase MIF-related protein [Thiohalomonadales bacterium]
MPYLSVQTNKKCSVTEVNDFLVRASKTVAALLKKPESYVMIAQPDTTPIFFAGNSDPCAYLCLKSIDFPEQRSAEISSGLCELINTCFGIDPARIYIEFSSPARHLWGWDKRTF